MQPATTLTPWRKTLRREGRGTYKRHTRPVETNEPRQGSTWGRRHRWQVPS